VYFALDILSNMASLKADKPVGTQLFGQGKKEAAPKASDGASSKSKGSASKSATKKVPVQKPQESKKKVSLLFRNSDTLIWCYILSSFYEL